MRPFRPGGIEALEGITPELIAEVCRVHVSTARRWKHGEEPPFAALQLLKLYVDGEIGVIDLKWAGWRISNGELIAPDQARFTPGEVLSVTYWRMLAKSYQADQRLLRQGDWVDERWKVAIDQTEMAAG